MYLVQTHLFLFFTIKMSDNSIKHTLINCEATREVVIMWLITMVQQTSLASTERYADGVEFIKSGLTQVPLICKAI
jgi:hypothetical protein